MARFVVAMAVSDIPRAFNSKTIPDKPIVIGFFCLLVLMFTPIAADARAFQLNGSKNPAPPLILKDLTGRQHKLDNYKGKVVLVNFWGSWCSPCVEEMPALQRLANRFAERGLVVLAVNVNQSDTAIERFMRGMSLDLTVLKDGNAKAAELWQVEYYPSSFAIDKHGNLRFASQGALDWDSLEADEMIQNLLQEAIN